MISFRLILQSGQEAGREYPLEKTEIFLGRDLNNDVVINDAEVSRKHARLILKGNTFSIEDLGSTNGTFMRGQRLTAPVLLIPDELITLGENVQLKFEVVMMDVNATVAAFRTQPPDGQQPASHVPAEFDAQKAPESPQPLSPEYIPAPAAPAAPAYPPVQPPVLSQPYVEAAAPAYQPIAPPQSTPRIAQAQTAEWVDIEPEIPPVKKRSPWLVALLVVVGIFLIFCLIPWLIIEVTDSYCALFPGIFNALQSGACP